MLAPVAPRAQVRGDLPGRGREIVDRPTLEFLGELDARFEDRRRELLGRRGTFRASVAAGTRPEFPTETEGVRTSDWRVRPPPEEIRDRRVEITGPAERKMVVNALNSGASVYMADFEDAHAPLWAATLAGQINLSDAVRRRIDFATADGREYRLATRTAVLMVRPRGWHLQERHVTVADRPMSASLVDFGLFFHHNARELRARGARSYFYLPKLEHYLEARLWNDVFAFSEDVAGLPRGTIRATSLIETLPAAFQMDEILYELREHSAGLNCGRWDYLFSMIKQYQDRPEVVFPDRRLLTMTGPSLAAYSRHLIAVCHRRGAHAMGGMAAQIPIRDDAEANARAIASVVADKEREARAGHDGTWVAHPGLVPIAREVFDRWMTTPNQIDRVPHGGPARPEELVELPRGAVTADGIRRNVRVSVRYLESWLRGAGCVPIDHLMEDAATVEISRSQLWQWIHHGATTEDGGVVDIARFRAALDAEVAELRAESGPSGRDAAIDGAVRLLDRAVTSEALAEFITWDAYDRLEPPSGGSG